MSEPGSFKVILTLCSGHRVDSLKDVSTNAASRMSRHCHYRVGDAVMNLELPGLSVYDDDAVVCQSLSLVNG
ncbi:hypothetical protein B5X24_HaOG201691 [Helicoverpa armigera]|nr:hypothetical protein B5X24_HaOG201691 [Helicoverpa armigera]